MCLGYVRIYVNKGGDTRESAPHPVLYLAAFRSQATRNEGRRLNQADLARARHFERSWPRRRERLRQIRLQQEQRRHREKKRGPPPKFDLEGAAKRLRASYARQARTKAVAV
jgi:hypothetical protein